MDLLTEQHAYGTAREAVQAYLKRGGGAGKSGFCRRRFTARRGNLRRRWNFSRWSIRGRLLNAKITKSLGEACLEADRPSEALAYADELVRSNGGTASSYYLKGRSELKLKWYREAKASLEEAAKQAPGDEDIRSDLTYVSGLLGEGINSMLKERLSRWNFPRR